MKLSEQVKMLIAGCDEFMPNKIQKFLIDEHGVEVSIVEIMDIQRTLGIEHEILNKINKQIKKYGKIETLKISWCGKILKIVITEGFENKMKSTVEIFEIVEKEAKGKFPQIGKSKIDNGIFSVEFKGSGE